MKTDITKLTDAELKELMYDLCRSGRLVINQFYFPEHLKNFNGGVEPTKEEVLTIQSAVEGDWSTQEYLDEAIEEIISLNI